MSTPLHVVHLIPRWVGGGPERSIIAEARECIAAGVVVNRTVVVLDPPVTPIMLMQARKLGIDVITQFDHCSLTELIAACDIVQLHYWNHPVLRAFLSSYTFPPARLLVTAHVLGTTLPQILPGDIGSLADALVVTSPKSRSTPGAHTAPQVCTIASIIDQSRLASCAQPPPRDPARPVVGYLGSLADAKLHPSIVDLCAAVTHTTARFVFRGSGADPDDLARRFGRQHLLDRVDVGGSVEDIATLLRGFDIFGYPLSPGTYATSDRTLQEAMWVGIAPVVLQGPAPSSLVEHGVTGLVVEEQDYPGAVDHLLSDPLLRHQLGDAAREWAHTTLDPARATAGKLGLYKDLLTSPKHLRNGPSGDLLSVAHPSGSFEFVCSLGGPAHDIAHDFAVSAGLAAGDITSADRAIAHSPPVLAHGEGGIVHYRNTFPRDPLLRWWSALVAHQAADMTTAEAEAKEAHGLGLADRCWP